MAKMFGKGARAATKFDPNDPFRIFQMDPPPNLSFVPKGRGYGQAAFFMLVVVFLVAASFQLYRNFAAKRDLAPFVFVELRAVDPNGHPVAGAKVRLGSADQGTTDSFGEWRRFLRLELGSRLQVSVAKQTVQGQLFATKNVTVPATPPKEGEAEVKASIQMSFKGKSRSQNSAVSSAPAAETAATILDPALGPTGPAVASAVAPVAPAAAVAAVAAPVETILKSKVPAPKELPNVSWPDTVALSVETPSPDAPATDHLFLADKVVPALKASLKAQGINISDESELTLRLGHVTLEDGLGLIRADLSWVHDGRRLEASFLRNFGKTVNETARALMVLMRTHVGASYQVVEQGGSWLVKGPPAALKLWQPESGQSLVNAALSAFPVSVAVDASGAQLLTLSTSGASPCEGSEYGNRCILRVPTIRDVPPITGWKPLRLRATGRVTPTLKIYVSGYEARRLGTNEWEYWGEAHGPANVTVLDQSRLVLRQRVTDLGNAFNQVALPLETVARK